MARVVLLGGGHSHIEVLRLAGAHRLPAELILVEPHPVLPYTGMVPGYVAGAYERADLLIDLVALCRRAGAIFKQALAVGLDAGSRRVTCDDGSTITYDVLSIDVGSVLDTSTPGVAEHAAAVRPLWRFITGWPDLAARSRSVAVVGAGAAGIELALAVGAGLQAHGIDPDINLVSDAHEIAAGLPQRARALLACACETQGIRVHAGRRVLRVTSEGVALEGGTLVPATTVLWATGPAAPAWFRHTGLTLDERGFLAVDRFLRVVGQPNVYAAGDAASMQGEPRPKSGVYAVRQGPVLFENLRRTLLRRPLRSYAPQRRALALIGTADGRAVGVYGSWAFEGRWVWKWKKAIDVKFVDRYRERGASLR